MNTPVQLPLLLLLLTAVSGAQQSASSPKPAQPANSQTASAPTADELEGLLHLDVVVTDPKGRPVLGLGAKDFSILDNGQPARILNFAAYQGSLQPPAPTAVILVLDTLRVPRPIEHLELTQIEAFLRQNGGHLPWPISLLALSDSGLWQVGQPSADGIFLADSLASRRFTSSPEPPVSGPVRPDSPGLDARPWNADAASAALHALGAIATQQRRVPGRKMLLWVGPGWGVASGSNPLIRVSTSRQQQEFLDTAVWFSTLLRVAHLTLYSFSAGPATPVGRDGDTHPSPDAQPMDHDLLRIARTGVSSPKDAAQVDLNRKVLAFQTGGRVFPPATDNLVNQLNDCLREASSFYTLSLNAGPAQHLDEFHQLQLNLRQPALTARTITGYYDQPWYADQPAMRTRRLSIAELEELLSSASGKSDGDLAHELAGLELTERLSQAEVEEWLSKLRGKKSRQELVALADLSAFLEPPSSAAASDPPPSEAEQRRMIARAVDSVNQTSSRLPDFFARRTALLYVESAPEYDGGRLVSPAQPLHFVQSSRGTVLYRNGGEVVDAKAQHDARGGSLNTYGTFGPALTAVRTSLARPEALQWSHWEQTPSGREAIFRFAIPAEQSMYWTGGCCLVSDDGRTRFARRAGYHGEIAMDPATGAVLRVSMIADLNAFVPIDRSEVTVSYGPVEIGGKTWICPLRSVSIQRSRSVDRWKQWDEEFTTWGPWVTMLNDFTFSDYHMFRAGVRILPGVTQVTEAPGEQTPNAADTEKAPQ